MRALSRYQQAFAINALRRASYKWPARTEALRKAKISYGQYKCADCEETFARKEIQLDHINPVVPEEGFDNLQDYAARLLVDVKGWQVLCKPCHTNKSNLENKERRKHARRKTKKRSKK